MKKKEKKLILSSLLLVGLILCSLLVGAKDVSKRKAKINNLRLKLKQKEVPEKRIKILKQLGMLYHQEAALGNEAAVDKAIKYLEEAKKLSDSPAIKAWYGSALTLRARYSSIFGKLYYSKKGIDILDKTVKLAPENIEVRLIRGVNSVYLPNFIFHRLDLVKKDLEYVVEKANQEPNVVSDKELVTAHLNLGKYYQKKEKPKLAIKEWEKVISLEASPTQSKRAKKYIKQISEENN